MRYGLPEHVQFCVRCVMSNQRPGSVREFANTPDSKKVGLFIDSEGVCDACRVAEQKAVTDWADREEMLRYLLAEYRSRDGSFDCVVPGSGGKDSFYAAHVLKHRFGMHPLTVTWAPHLYTDWGRRNHQRWIDAGFTNILVTPDSRVHRLLTRLAVELLFHPFQAFMLGQKALAPKLAVQFGIPLVFYGESEAEYGNPKADTETAVRDSSYYASIGDEIYLGGVNTASLRDDYGLTHADLAPYLPASQEALERAQVDVRYLGYYLKWRPQDCYYYACEHGNFEASPERTPGTYSKYNSLDDKIDDFHYWTTYQKFGLGRASYDAAQEVRSGDITREEAVALVHRFDGEWPTRFAAEINEYLSVPGFEPMTNDRWHQLARQFRPEHLWDGDKLRHVVT